MLSIYIYIYMYMLYIYIYIYIYIYRDNIWYMLYTIYYFYMLQMIDFDGRVEFCGSQVNSLCRLPGGGVVEDSLKLSYPQHMSTAIALQPLFVKV